MNEQRIDYNITSNAQYNTAQNSSDNLRSYPQISATDERCWTADNECMLKSAALTAAASSSLTGRNINGGDSPSAVVEAQRKLLQLAQIMPPLLLPPFSDQEPDSTHVPNIYTYIYTFTYSIQCIYCTLTTHISKKLQFHYNVMHQWFYVILVFKMQA